MKNKYRLALFISGSGSTGAAIISAVKENRLNLIPALVVASKEGISGILKVQSLGIPKKDIVVISPKLFGTENKFADKLIQVCRKGEIDLIGQYGWMPKTPKKFIIEYRGKIINQHPGPLDPPGDDFGGKGMYGRRVHCAVLYFRRITRRDLWTEATAHLVTEEFDRGEIVKRRKIKILSSETVEDLQEKVLPIEHQVQIEALDDFAKDRVKIFKRNKPLVKNGEIAILRNAKEIAKILYPFG